MKSESKLLSVSKWYKAINEFAAANDCRSETLADAIADVADRLQHSFTMPWQNATPAEILDVREIQHLLKNISPRLPSIGQIKATLKYLNPRKATDSDYRSLHGC